MLVGRMARLLPSASWEGQEQRPFDFESCQKIIPPFKYMRRRTQSIKKMRFALFGTGWAIIVLAGVGLFWSYENRPGQAAAAPLDWPSASSIERSEEHPTLIIFAHPHCSCTRATIHELARLMSDNPDNLSAFVLFVKPEGAGEGWDIGDNWEEASKIPGVTLLHDDLGAEARLFDAHTSGQAMLFSARGELLFSGGITVGRGRQGVSAGESAISAILVHKDPTTDATNVYGCPLFNDEAFCRVKTGAFK